MYWPMTQAQIDNYKMWYGLADSEAELVSTFDQAYHEFLLEQEQREREQREYDSLVAMDQSRPEDEGPADSTGDFFGFPYPADAIEPPNANEFDWEREIMLDESGDSYEPPADFYDRVMSDNSPRGSKRKAEKELPRHNKQLKSDPIAISANWRRLRKYSIPNKSTPSQDKSD